MTVKLKVKGKLKVLWVSNRENAEEDDDDDEDEDTPPPEMAATARTVCAPAPLIPIIADADTSGGNALNVQRTVKDLIAAGVAGCFLEISFANDDGNTELFLPFMAIHQLIEIDFSSRIKHGQRSVVIPAEDHAAKIASARDAAGDSDFFLVARTDARATSAKTGLSDAISRANL
ncbi:hypothetical protein NC652_005813 [Populus alba x Populus x berolinensis]|nr:hypothetical protein NC652_005813 [Populus alba x Populus x berolinensis]